MNILILSRQRFNTTPFHEILDYENDNLFLFIDDDLAQRDTELILSEQKKYKKIVRYKNYPSNGLIEVDALELNREYKLDAIIALQELDILRAARLREELHLKGQHLKSAIAYRDKLEMKKYASQKGLCTPKAQKITCGVELAKFAESVGYPIFVKPISSAGSVGARAIRNKCALKQFLAYDLKNLNDPFCGYIQTMQVEEYIDKNFYNINGIVMDNKLVLFHAAKYNTHADLEHIEKYGYWSSSSLSRNHELYSIMKDFIDNLLEALPSPENFAFHCEVFIDELEKRVILCEIASRLPGGGIDKAMSWTFDIKLFELAVLLQLQPSLIDRKALEYKSNTYNKLYASIFLHPKQGIMLDAKKECDLWYVDEYALLGECGKEYNKTGSYSTEGIAIFVVSGENENILEEHIQTAITWFWENSKWELN